MHNRDRILLSQIHTAKLATDISASVASIPLLWAGRRRVGLAVHYLPPIVASTAVLRADLVKLCDTRRGGYVLNHMPPIAQTLRLAGDTLMVIGASKRNAALIAAGFAVVLAGWSHGLLRT
jgi:hypothetical protein